MKAVENAPTSEISYYTVNRVCHLETRVLQARSHGQACSREHMHTAKVVHYPTPFTPPIHSFPERGGLWSSHHSRDQICIGFVLKSQTFTDQQDKNTLNTPKLDSQSVVYLVTKRHQSRY